MENNEFDEYEPPKKIMKYDNVNGNSNSSRKIWQSELELVQFKIGYVTKKGNILLEKKNDDSEDNDILLIDINNKPIEVYILNFQTFEGGEAYLISNTSDNKTDTISKIDINKGYTIREIFNNFMKADYLIGILHYYYKKNYENGIITDVSTFDDDSNDEIRLHYTKTRGYEGNVAWRTIKWDLFEEFVLR
jgi:hypothetical protein